MEKPPASGGAVGLSVEARVLYLEFGALYFNHLKSNATFCNIGRVSEMLQILKCSVAFGHSKQLHLKLHQNGCLHLLLTFSISNLDSGIMHVMSMTASYLAGFNCIFI